VDPVPARAFEGSTGFLLSLAGSLARRSWSRMLAERDLTPHQYGVLMTLHEVGPVDQQRLSRLIGIDPRNAGQIIESLVARGLLRRDMDPADRRRRVLTLTRSGRLLVRRLARGGATIEAEFLRPLTAADQRSLHRILVALLGSAAADRN